MDLTEWQNEEAPVTIDTNQLDDMVRTLKVLEAKKKEQEEIAKATNEEYQSQRETIIKTLQAIKKTSYSVDGVGSVTLVSKYTVTTPKEVADKKALFNYIKDKYGGDALMGYATINYQTLNSFYNTERDLAEAAGEAAFLLPGIRQPSLETNIQFRKK